jgi:hypothetical protein
MLSTGLRVAAAATTGALGDEWNGFGVWSLRLGLETDRKLIQNARALDIALGKTPGGYRSQRRGIGFPALC